MFVVGGVRIEFGGEGSVGSGSGSWGGVFCVRFWELILVWGSWVEVFKLWWIGCFCVWVGLGIWWMFFYWLDNLIWGGSKGKFVYRCFENIGKFGLYLKCKCFLIWNYYWYIYLKFLNFVLVFIKFRGNNVEVIRFVDFVNWIFKYCFWFELVYIILFFCNNVLYRNGIKWNILWENNYWFLESF